MSDRLAELVRQRALVAEHLAWLDRQVAEAAQKSLAPPTQVVAPSPSPPSQTAAIAVTAADPSATVTSSGSRSPMETEDILAQYRVHPAALKDDVRKGCFLYFVAAFVALGLGLLLLYFLLRPR